MRKTYKVRYQNRALKQLQKMDSSISSILIRWIESNLIGCNNPRFSGKPLSGKFKGNWRYRVGDYRIIADIRDDEIVILIVNIGHRRDIYR